MQTRAYFVAVAVEGVKDVPKLLDAFRNSDGALEDLASKFEARVRAIKMREQKQQAKGLGGFIRGRMAPPGSQ